MPVSPHLNLLHACSPLWGVQHIPRLLDLLLENNICRVSSVSIMDSEPAVMSEFSSDAEPDLEDELHKIQTLPAPVSLVSTFRFSNRWSRRRVTRRRLFPSYL